MTKPTNPYAHAYADFLRETAEHQLVVLHDDGLYRHLRIQKPGTRIWSWDITTWQSHYSDGAPSIDVHYWAEKLCGGRSYEVEMYDADVRGFRARGRPRRRSSHPTTEAVQS
ncbi:MULTISPECIES: hypothetical protein [unclassified Streptomyces]|uniref:hypothetical protein n=1 Tax=unclassified Streptomyces TaxID=2593676 RepID=UPI000CD50DF9|nr:MULTISPECIES: hypothetical protein [unclassified Streptomyces]MCX4573236.1 hypothetical protein [Streptomyces sp. NBC_01571]